MADFPSDLVPQAKTYNFNSSNNIISQPLNGGSPVNSLDFKTGPVMFEISLLCTDTQKETFTSFFYNDISSGADPFNMNIDDGIEISSQEVNIIPGSVKISSVNTETWFIRFRVIAATTVAETAPFGGNLSDLYEVYGRDIQALFDALAFFVLVVLPEDFPE